VKQGSIGSFSPGEPGERTPIYYFVVGVVVVFILFLDFFVFFLWLIFLAIGVLAAVGLWAHRGPETAPRKITVNKEAIIFFMSYSLKIKIKTARAPSRKGKALPLLVFLIHPPKRRVRRNRPALGYRAQDPVPYPGLKEVRI
jgi:hypothetical protein